MIPLDVVRAEHEVARGLCRLLVGVADAIERGERVPARDLDRALDLLAEFVDRRHFAKEEAVLFPTLRKLHPGSARTFDRLEEDHTTFRRHLAAARRAIPRAASGDPEGRAAFAAAAREAATVLPAHFEREEVELLARLAMPLRDEALLVVVSEFARVDREASRGGAVDVLESEAVDLARRYLPEPSDTT